MQVKRVYQVQHWPNGQWDRAQNWRKVEAASEKEAAEKVCGFALAEAGRLAQLRARVLKSVISNSAAPPTFTRSNWSRRAD